MLGSTVLAVNDASADVVSVSGKSDNRSPVLQFSAADPPRRGSPHKPTDRSNPLLYETGDRSLVT